MNTVNLIGRLASKPELKHSAEGMAFMKFTVAVDRRTKDKAADFIRCTAFGMKAEIIDKFVKIGNHIGITAHIQTGSYEKDGATVYTTDFIVDQLTLVGTKPKEEQETKPADVPGFEVLVDDIPF